jgi:hypothetical protein
MRYSVSSMVHRSFRVEADDRRAAMELLIDPSTRPYRWWKTHRSYCITPNYQNVEVWYGDTTEALSYLLIDQHAGVGTLGFDILHFLRDIPAGMYDQSYRIIGNESQVLMASDVPALPVWTEGKEDPEPGVAAALAALPLVDVDASLHFLKTCLCVSEIHNLQRCEGERAVVQLLGRSSTDQLVLERHPKELLSALPASPSSKWGLASFDDIKHRLLQLISAVAALHARGVVHRDLVTRNVLVSSNDAVVLCDIEGYVSTPSCRAPELWTANPSYTPQSDVYALGTMVWGMCYKNNPRVPVFYDLFPVPAPLDVICRACMQDDPWQRPSLAALQAMVEGAIEE